MSPVTTPGPRRAWDQNQLRIFRGKVEEAAELLQVRKIDLGLTDHHDLLSCSVEARAMQA